MIPYNIIDPEIPIPQAFDYIHFGWAKVIVSVGAIASLATWLNKFDFKLSFYLAFSISFNYLSLYAAMFPMPRVVYSLASDGLIFRFLAYIMPRLKTPVAAAISSGLFAGNLIFV
jgi:amino acid transporter